MDGPAKRTTLDYARPTPPRPGPGVPTPKGVLWIAAVAAVGGLGGVVVAARFGYRGGLSGFQAFAAMLLGGVSFTVCAGGAATLYCMVMDRPK